MIYVPFTYVALIGFLFFRTCSLVNNWSLKTVLYSFYRLWCCFSLRSTIRSSLNSLTILQPFLKHYELYHEKYICSPLAILFLKWLESGIILSNRSKLKYASYTREASDHNIPIQPTHCNLLLYFLYYIYKYLVLVTLACFCVHLYIAIMNLIYQWTGLWWLNNWIIGQ